MRYLSPLNHLAYTENTSERPLTLPFLCRLPRPASSSVDILHGVLVPAALVGDVLQILEFLATFAEVVDLPHLSESKLLHELLEADRLPRGDRCTLGQVSNLRPSFSASSSNRKELDVENPSPFKPTPIRVVAKQRRRHVGLQVSFLGPDDEGAPKLS